MSKTKIAIALVALAALALVVVGLVSAQVINQTVPTATPNNLPPNAAANGDFFGWIGRCFGFITNQQYYVSTPYVAPQVPPLNSSAPAPYVPYQGNYGYGYGYGPCMGRFLP